MFRPSQPPQSGFIVLPTTNPVIDTAPNCLSSFAVDSSVRPRVITSSISITFFPTKKEPSNTNEAAGLSLFPAKYPDSLSTGFEIASYEQGIFVRWDRRRLRSLYRRIVLMWEDEGTKHTTVLLVLILFTPITSPLKMRWLHLPSLKLKISCRFLNCSAEAAYLAGR